MAAALALGVALVYFPTNFDGKPVFDDAANLFGNAALSGLDPLRPADWWRAAFSSPATLRPVSYLSFALQWALGGDSLWALHLASDLLHALAAAALFALLRELLLAHGGGREAGRINGLAGARP